MMTFAELKAANTSRCAKWHKGGVKDWSLSDWGVAAGGEMGEALNVIKKLNRERDGLVGNTATKEALQAHLATEIADVVIYLDLLAQRAGIDLATAVAEKFNYVSEREGFPERLNP